MAGPANGAAPSRRFDRLGLLLGCAAVFLVFLVAEFDAGARGTVNEVVFDRFQRWKPRPYDPELPVRIVDIDRRSLELFGQWPWPRTVLAALTERLSEAGAAVIGFDMVFAEPDRTSPELTRALLSALDTPGTLPPLPATSAHDAVFAAALGRANSVLGALISSAPGSEPFPTKASFSVAGPDPAEAIEHVPGLEMPIAALADGAAGIGAVGFLGAGGLVARKVPMVVVHEDRKVPAFALETLRLALGARSYLLKSSGASGEGGLAGRPEVVGVRVGPLEIPLAPDGGLRVRYAGHRPERSLPAWQPLTQPGAEAAWRSRVAGQIVLIGSSAPGISQAVDTPLAAAQLWVEVSAEAIEQILSGDYLVRPYWAAGAERALVLFFGLLVTAVMARGRMAAGAITTLAALYFIGGASWFAFDARGYLIGPIFPMLGAVVPFALLGGVGYVRTDAEKRAIREQFEHFLAPEVIAEIAADPARYLTPGGEERELAILFCDVRDFSTLTEAMPPQRVVSFVNRFLTPISEAIIRQGGTIDKFMGDAVMAFWNAPRQTPDYRAQAVRAVFAIRRTVDALNRSARPRAEPEIRIGIGLNSGPCSVGFMGSERRLEYSCIGDAVNLASRLEGLCKFYDVWNCVGDAAIREVPGVLAVELDLVVVKGFTRPSPVWTLLSDDADPAPGLVRAAEALREARAAFIARDWDAAEAAFRELAARPAPGFDPARVARAYLARIARYRAVPPPEDWTGAFIASEK